MKIVQINAVYGEKSTGVIVKDISDMLISNGEKSYVVSPFVNEENERVFAIGNPLDRKLHAIYARMTGKQGLASFVATKKMINRIRKLKPDVIHVHNIHSNFINYRLLLTYTAIERIPVVITLHDCWMFTGKCYHFQDIQCEKWKFGCGNCPKRRVDIPSIIVDSSEQVYKLRKNLYQKNNMFVIGCSEWIANLAKQSPLFQGVEVSYIRNGIDTNVFTPLRRKKVDDTKFIILTMANKWFLPENEIVVQKIISNLNKLDKLIIVGCNDKQKNYYINNPSVMSVGYVTSRGELADLYSNADVFLNLTSMDTLPTVNMESLSCGTPVITYNVGGSGELVVDGRTGYVVKQHDYRSVVRSLDMIRHGLIHRDDCRSYAEKWFEKEKNYKQYIELYRKILLVEGDRS